MTNLNVKFYKFKILPQYPVMTSDVLIPPFGNNLLAVLQHHKELRKVVAEIFSEYGYKFVLKPQEGRIELQKLEDDIAIAHPFSLISDTLQRIVFYLVAIDTNSGAVLLLEEPESNSFPYYTKYLAERIAQDGRNQYFLTTHNPYLILSLLEKSKIEDIAVHATGFRDYQTVLRTLTNDQLAEILDQEFDLFFNVDQYFETAE